MVPHVLHPRRFTTIALLAFALAVILLAAAPAAFAAAPPNGGWYPGPTLGSPGTGYAQFQWPLGVVVGSSGNIFVADYLNGRAEKLSAQGEYLGQTPYLGATADSIAIDHRGLIYVGTGASAIYVYDQNLDYLATISGYFGGDIFGMAFDSADNLYVSDISNDRIVVFDSAWTYQGHFGDGAFSAPWGLAVDSSNNLYVADISNSGIQVWTSGGTYLTTIASGTVSYTTQLTIRDDILYADTYTFAPASMFVLGLDGSYLQSIGSGSISSYGGTVGPDGTAYMADFNGSVVDTFLFDGTPPTAWDDWDDQWKNGDITVDLYAADDGSGLRGFTWLGLWTPLPTPPLELTLSTTPGHCGIVLLDYSATDNVGNQSATKTVFLKYDRVPPVTTVSGLPSGNGMQPVTAVLQATDVGSGVYTTWYDLDDAGWALAPADGQIPVTTEGAHTLRYYSNDIAGNGEDVKEADFTLKFSAPYPWDTTPPTVTSDADGQWHSLETTVALAGTDDVGAISEMDYRINGGGWTAYSYPPGIDIPDPQDHSNDGVKKIEFTATDDSDNTSAVQTGYVKIDTWKPRTRRGRGARSGERLDQRRRRGRHLPGRRHRRGGAAHLRHRHEQHHQRGRSADDGGRRHVRRHRRGHARRRLLLERLVRRSAQRRDPAVPAREHRPHGSRGRADREPEVRHRQDDQDPGLAVGQPEPDDRGDREDQERDQGREDRGAQERRHHGGPDRGQGEVRLQAQARRLQGLGVRDRPRRQQRRAGRVEEADRHEVTG